MSTCSSPRQYRHRKTQHQIREFLLFVVFLASCLGWFYWDWQQANAKVEALIFQPQIVQTGDTLWSIAEEAKLPIDTRTLVLKIMDYNHLPDPSIQTGQIIYTPVKQP
jgi:hypothetical protein